MRHPAFPPRRGGVRATTWWGRVWLRTVEDTAYDDADVAAGWRLARAGAVGAIDVDGGRVLAAVRTGESGRARSVGAPMVDADELVACSVLVPVLDAADRQALVEVIAASSGRVASLLAGDLPTDLAEHAEEAGVSLLPDDLDCSCTCGAWVQPCGHALAVLAQLAWLFDADPFVLLALRGMPRDHLLAEVAAVAGAGYGEEPTSADEVDLDVAGEAAERAARLLDKLD
ncbi:SWIM zinc finger family protein [Nocardioides jejuensis]|uniref:SWIM-type domain-containing protein n=1 Tax=Nocardioides jejuensis TaxID=2502782 RepID=A0A4R1CH04_9ACTN|nr:SWIM zinc finger family protein [Nocardioides jejuensis]TCJ30510.1 hypothetical protein EPD65_02755 [Nocardioides jejuensis]